MDGIFTASLSSPQEFFQVGGPLLQLSAKASSRDERLSDTFWDACPAFYL